MPYSLIIGRLKKVISLGLVTLSKVTKTQKALECSHYHKKVYKEQDCWITHPDRRPNRASTSGKGSSTDSISEENTDLAMIALNRPSATVDQIDLELDTAEYKEYSYYSALHLNNKLIILDSGATVQICCNKLFFSNIQHIERGVSWEDISKLKASGIGCIPILFRDTNQKAVLRNCL